MGFWGYHGVVSIIFYIIDIGLAITFLLRVTEVIPASSWKYLELVLAAIALASNIAYWIFLGCCGQLYATNDETIQENDLRSQHHSKSTIYYLFAVIAEAVFLIEAAKVDPIDPDIIVTNVTYNPAMMMSYSTQKVVALACFLLAIGSLSTVTDYYFYQRTDRDVTPQINEEAQLITKPAPMVTHRSNKKSMEDVDL